MPPKKYVEGVETVAQAFQQIPLLNQQKIAVALNKSGAEIAARMKQLAPVGKYRGGGDLRESIHAQEIKIGKRGLIKVITAGDTRQTANAAFRQEFGRKASADGHPGHVAQEFAFPAYWSIRKRVIGRIRRAIKAAAKAVVNG